MIRSPSPKKVVKKKKKWVSLTKAEIAENAVKTEEDRLKKEAGEDNSKEENNEESTRKSRSKSRSKSPGVRKPRSPKRSRSRSPRSRRPRSKSPLEPVEDMLRRGLEKT